MTDRTTCPPGTQSEEWAPRRQLTDFYHPVEFLGWT